MKKPWFGIKPFWGLYPTTFEGWIIVGTMVLTLVFIFLLTNINSQSVGQTLVRAFPFFSLTVSTTIFICLVSSSQPEFGRIHLKSKNYSPDQPEAYLFLSFLVLPTILYYLIFNSLFSAFVLFLTFIVLFLVYRHLKNII